MIPFKLCILAATAATILAQPPGLKIISVLQGKETIDAFVKQYPSVPLVTVPHDQPGRLKILGVLEGQESIIKYASEHAVPIRVSDGAPVFEWLPGHGGIAESHHRSPVFPVQQALANVGLGKPVATMPRPQVPLPPPQTPAQMQAEWNNGDGISGGTIAPSNSRNPLVKSAPTGLPQWVLDDPEYQRQLEEWNSGVGKPPEAWSKPPEFFANSNKRSALGQQAPRPLTPAEKIQKWNTGASSGIPDVLSGETKVVPAPSNSRNPYGTAPSNSRNPLAQQQGTQNPNSMTVYPVYAPASAPQQSYSPIPQQSYPPIPQQSYPRSTQQSYPPFPQRSYPRSTQQSYPPFPQQSYPPFPQQSYPRSARQSYPPFPQQSYPPFPQQSYPPIPQQSYPRSAQQQGHPLASHLRRHPLTPQQQQYVINGPQQQPANQAQPQPQPPKPETYHDQMVKWNTGKRDTPPDSRLLYKELMHEWNNGRLNDPPPESLLHPITP